MTFAGKRFRFVYEEADADFARAVVAAAEDTYEEVAARFRIPAARERFTFMICPDAAAFVEATGRAEGTWRPWMVGFADYGRRFACVLSPRAARDRAPAEMIGVVKHEVTHIVFDALGNPDEAPIGVSEGIAVCVAGQAEPELLDESACPSMAGLNSEETFHENDGYNYSGVYVRHFLRKFGAEAFKRVYTGAERLESYLYDGFEAEAIREAKG